MKGKALKSIFMSFIISGETNIFPNWVEAVEILANPAMYCFLDFPHYDSMLIIYYINLNFRTTTKNCETTNQS